MAALVSALLFLALPGLAADSTSPASIPAWRQAEDVAIIPIRGEIDRVTLHSLERRMKEARESGADAVVLAIDTPGGRLDATLDICNLLKDPAVTGPNVVAWIRPQAYSAGTIIALAAREIIVTPNATFGDAAPIHGMPLVGLIEMEATERAKIEAPILAEVIDSARRNHYDEKLVQSFVSIGVSLWLIEHVGDGRRVFVDQAECELIFGSAPTAEITRVTPPEVTSALAPVYPFLSTMSPRLPMSPSEQAWSAEEIREQIEFQQSRPSTRPSFARSAPGEWRMIGQVISSDRLLTVKAPEALHYGLASAVVGNETELRSFFGASTVRVIESTWSEQLTRFLISWPVRAVLALIFIICTLIEMATPGVGIFGLGSACSLVLLLGAPSLVGMAQWWEVALILAGVVLVAIEVFVIPGFGVIGVAGLACILVGFIGSFVSGDMSGPEARGEMTSALLSMLVVGVGLVIFFWIASRWLTQLPLFRRLVLSAQVNGGETATSAAGRSGGARTDRSLQAGDEGIAETDLRPSGRARFGERLLDVQSVGPWVSRGERVRVVRAGLVAEVESAGESRS